MAVWRGRNIGIIFQFFQLLPMLSLIENIMLPMDFGGVYNLRQRKERALHLLDLVGIADHAYKLPSAVSGGQQQRAAIARAIANNPPLIVADEPTGMIDPGSSAEVMQVLDKINSLGTTVLMATHDFSIVDRMKRRVIRVENGRVISDKNEGKYNG